MLSACVGCPAAPPATPTRTGCGRERGSRQMATSTPHCCSTQWQASHCDSASAATVPSPTAVAACGAWPGCPPCCGGCAAAVAGPPAALAALLARDDRYAWEAVAARRLPVRPATRTPLFDVPAEDAAADAAAAAAAAVERDAGSGSVVVMRWMLTPATTRCVPALPGCSEGRAATSSAATPAAAAATGGGVDDGVSRGAAPPALTLTRCSCGVAAAAAAAAAASGGTPFSLRSRTPRPAAGSGVAGVGGAAAAAATGGGGGLTQRPKRLCLPLPPLARGGTDTVSPGLPPAAGGGGVCGDGDSAPLAPPSAAAPYVAVPAPPSSGEPPPEVPPACDTGTVAGVPSTPKRPAGGAPAAESTTGEYPAGVPPAAAAPPAAPAVPAAEFCCRASALSLARSAVSGCTRMSRTETARPSRQRGGSSTACGPGSPSCAAAGTREDRRAQRRLCAQRLLLPLPCCAAVRRHHGLRPPCLRSSLNARLRTPVHLLSC